MTKELLSLGTSLLLLGIWACSGPADTVELRHFPVSSLDGVLTRSGVFLDTEVTSDGNGALRIEADGPTTVRLYESGDLDVEDARHILVKHKWEPQPLYDIWIRTGIEHFAEQQSADEWWIYLRKPSAK